MFVTIQHWLAANPLFALIIWSASTACVNAGFEYIRLHENDSKWAQALNGFFQMFGVDAGVVVKWLRAVFPNAPPGDGGAGTSAPRRDAVPPGVERPPSALRRALLAPAPLLLALSVALSGAWSAGCKLLHDAVPVLQQIVAYVTDAEAIISGLENAAQLFFLAHPDAVKQAAFQKADARLRATLDTISRLAAAGKDLDSEDVVAAVRDFQAAYGDFANLLRSFGVDVPAPGNGTVGAHVQTEPMLMSVHVTEAGK